MRPIDLLILAVSALWRQKLRTVLTLTGVIVGGAVLTASLAVGGGISKAIEEQFRQNDRLRRIDVFRDFDGDLDLEKLDADVVKVEGSMSDTKRRRLREKLAERQFHYAQAVPSNVLTMETLDRIREWDHVARVVPAWYQQSRVFHAGRTGHGQVRAVPIDHPSLVERVEVGRGFSSPDAAEVLVSELLLYDLGVRDDSEVADAIGGTLRLEIENAPTAGPSAMLGMLGIRAETLAESELAAVRSSLERLRDSLEKLGLSEQELQTLRRLLSQQENDKDSLEKVTVTAEFRIVGVIRVLTRKDREDMDWADLSLGDMQVVLPLRTGEQFFNRLPIVRKGGMPNAAVFVDHEDHVRAVQDRIDEAGYQTFSLAKIAEQVRTNVLLVGFGMNFIALVALTVAAIGITNTLFTSVIERTREIGVMKAVGARDRHIQMMFLLEGALIGLVGGGLGVVSGWLLSLPGEEWARSMMAKQTEQEVPGDLFAYPTWLILGVPAFAMAVTTLAALYPARRAARVQPVVALRYE